MLQVLAHAGAVQRFREMNITGKISFKANGAVSVIVLYNKESFLMSWNRNVPLTNSTEDENARERDVAFGLGLYAEPVFGTGNWPEIALETLPPSILPRFTAEEQSLIKGESYLTPF